MFSRLYNKLFDYSIKNVNHICFKNLLEFANTDRNQQISISTNHLYHEMPIRLAQRVKDLNGLPFGLNNNHNISIIRDWYLTSFEELVSLRRPKTLSDCYNFKTVISRIFERHAPTLNTMAKGIIELRNAGHLDDSMSQHIQQFLNRFHMNRTEIRILIQQYLELYREARPGYYGIINRNVNVRHTVEDAKKNIEFICRRGDYIIDVDSIIQMNGKGHLPFIEDYLYYILFELVKNSVQAVIDRKPSFGKTPYVKIDILDISNYIYVVIEDNGVGIRETDLAKIWLYSFSTNPLAPHQILETRDFSNNVPLSGFGYGLPITKLYLDFFDSFIRIDSTYGVGTKVHLFLKKYK